MVATTPRETPYIPWYLRWDIPTLVPGVLLSFVMVWSVIQSIANANWADGLQVLVAVALPGLLVGIIFARLRWLPAWLAHLLAAALGIAPGMAAREFVAITRRTAAERGRLA